MGGERDFGSDGARAALVVDVEGYLAGWKQLLASLREISGVRPHALAAASVELQARARACGFGGLAHHLSRLDALVDGDQRFPVTELGATLEDVGQLLQQAKDALSPVEHAYALPLPPMPPRPPAQGPANAGAGPPAGEIAPPPLLTAYRTRSDFEPAPPPALQPPPPVSLPGAAQAGGDTMVSEAGPAGMLFRDRRPAASSSPAPSEPPRLDTTPSAPPQVAVAPKAGFAVVQPAPSVGVVGRTLFGLRAFGSARAKAETPPANAPGSILGLGGVGRAPPAPPPLISAPLPSLHEHPKGGAMTDFLRRRNKPSAAKAAPKRERRAAKPRAQRPRGARDAVRTLSWGFVALGGVGLLATVLVIVLLVTRRSQPDDENPTTSISGAPRASGPPAHAALPSPGLTTVEEHLQGLLPQIHQHGGKESPELRNALDQDAELQLKLGRMPSCEGSEALCSEWRKARQLFSLPDAGTALAKRRRPPSALRSRWLLGLTLPEIGVEDDERVRREFEFNTEHAAGRERFQTMLFRCGSYRDQIQATLARYDLPESLMAVVMAESACIVEAKSPKNALGLWQFIPGAARAYNLRVIEDVVDERLSPAKSSEAAARFLADMYRKFGSWDLVFAGYNCGPFGMATRLHLAGADARFWDLVDASLVPEETAGYVPRIQAYALIMKNLSRLKFAGAQMRAPEVTADLDAPPGTRLGLIARAASTSVIQIRRLNRDILGDVVPDIPGQKFAVQVPRDVVFQARESLQELLDGHDKSDLCVPPTFDWGREHFTDERAARCKPTEPAAEATTPK
ncbi:MAG TPA: lytic transglycosylase domain-containing protein [Polyangiaceae bacterium]